MILFCLLLLDPSSFLHPRGPDCAVPRNHAPSASCARAILDRGPLFVFDDPAEEPECGESAAVVRAPRLGPAASRRAVCKTHQLFLQRTVIGLGLIGTDAEG